METVKKVSIGIVVAVIAIFILSAVFGGEDEKDAAGDDASSGDTPSTTDAEPTEPTETEPQATVDDRVFPGGQPLTEYQGYDSYPWRVAVVDQQDELLATMQDVAPHLEVDDYGDLISTCDSANGGTDRATLITQGVTRFSGGSDEQVSEQQATTLVDLALTRVCPGLI